MVSLIYELKAVNITLVAQTRHQPASRPTQQTVQVFNTTVLQNETFFQIKDYLKQFCVNKVCLLSLKNTAYLTRGTKQYKLVGKPQVSFSVSLVVVHIQLKNITNCILFSCAQLDQSRLFSSTLQTKYDTELKLVLK